MNSERFGDLAPRLAANGYHPVPLRWGEKRPALDAWQRYAFAQADAQKYANSGTGILTGDVIGADIDVRDPALAAEIEKLAQEMFGSAPRRIGQAPKVLRLLRAAAPFAKLSTRGYRLPSDAPGDKGHRVEILAGGQQFVAYGTHPDTKAPYEWNGVGDPLTVPIGMLPVVTEEQAREFIAAAEQLLAKHAKPVGKLADEDDRRHHEPNEELVASDAALLRQALAAIPNDDIEFDDWIRVLYAVKGGLGDNGLRDFLTWSAKSTKDVATFSTHEYLAAKPTRIGAGTIYHLAQSFGWKRPESSREPPWPRPIDILSELAAAPFDADCLPEELACYPSLYAHATGFDPSITLTAAASAAAAALSDDFRICGDSGTNWFESSRLWFLTIAYPGAGKTPGQREMVLPLRELHAELSRQYEKALAQWKRDAKRAEDETEVGPEPARPRLILDDTTIERLSDVLRDNPRGVLVIAEEFDSWIGSLDQYRSGEVGRDRGQWLAAFDGGPHTVERVKRGTVFVENWGASILTASTPAAMARLTRHLPIDGLLQRFVAVIATRKQRPLTQPNRAELERERARYRETLRRLWAATPRAHHGVVQLSLEARECFEAWLRNTELLQEAFSSIEPALEAHFAKHAAIALRLTLTFHAARIVSHEHPEARDPAAFPVAATTLQQALRFLRRESQHAQALYLNRKGASHAYELAQAIARFVLARKPEENARGLHRRDIIQRVRAYRDADERVQARALDLLVDIGWLRPSPDGYLKAAPTRYTVNPQIAELFATQAERERERRALARDRIAEAVRDRRESGQ